MESYMFDLESDLPATFYSGGGTTTTESCLIACDVQCLLCEAMRMFASTNPGGVDGDAEEAGLVEVEPPLVSASMGVGFGGGVDGRAAKHGGMFDEALYGVVEGTGDGAGEGRT
ncbi:hypothetical protein FOMPIDRAFT_1055474 [Fomitopsis schrenkii]|uniref:Uncharacterized protein n=1 Tax=Fomitopsis schrenkii TaxID=2126942 RepID=S8EWK2_FOMSC|nr:hypothetical protein FOMPIDRAFT_1055474 [Fomitopsis schrenkii]